MKARIVRTLVGVALLCSVAMAKGLIGKKAPEIAVRQWVTQNSSEFVELQGKVYVLEFWATWCRPCVQNIPHLIELTDKYKQKGVEFISLSADKSATDVQRFVQEKKINYHVAIDNGTADWYGIRGDPTAVVVNHKGIVVWKGYPWEHGFERAIVKSLAAGPPPLLNGVDLGPFEYLKKDLWGGRKFASAYRKIKTCAAGGRKTQKAALARTIIEAIDSGIYEKTSQAQSLQNKDLIAAFRIYAFLIDNYYDIEATEAAKQAYEQLKESVAIKKRTIVAKTFAEIAD